MTSDLALAANPAFLGTSADPEALVTRACERAAARLRQALEAGDIGQVAEIRSQAEAVRACAARMRLGKDAQLSAAETARRAERGVALAIRRGQAAGTIRRQHEHSGNQHTGRDGHDRGNVSSKPGPTHYAKQDELSGSGRQPGFYDLADGVTDEDFEAALAEARAEGNLSRANVARKAAARAQGDIARDSDGEWIPGPDDRGPFAPAQRRKLIRSWADRGFSSQQIAGRLGLADRSVRDIARAQGITVAGDDAVHRTRRHDSARIARETVHALEGLAMGAGLVDYADLDPGEAKDWADSLTASIRVLSRFARQIKEIKPSE